MRLYGRYFLLNLQGQMRHRAAFFMSLAGNFLTSFTALAGVGIMLSRFGEAGAFTHSQVLLCFASVLASFSLAEVLARGFDRFPRMLGNGEFDRILVRPRGAVFQVLASKMEFSHAGRLIQAIGVFVWAIPKSGVDWTAARVLTLFLMVVCGAAVFFGLFLIYAAFSFFTVEGLEFMNIFTDGGREFGRYPFSVYGKGVLRFLTWVIPLALVQYYPLLYLLGMEDGAEYMLAPLPGLFFLIPSWAFFRFGLRRYRSTGS